METSRTRRDLHCCGRRCIDRRVMVISGVLLYVESREPLEYAGVAHVRIDNHHPAATVGYIQLRPLGRLMRVAPRLEAAFMA